jgi:hypothetical protein
MSDRAAVTLYCDLPAWPADVLDALEEEFGGDALGGHHSMGWEEITVGSVLDGEIPNFILSRFQEAGVDFDFDVWQDPKYDSLGDVWRHRVDHSAEGLDENGNFVGACDAAGHVVLWEDTLRSVAVGHADPGSLLELLGPEPLDFTTETS